MQLNPVRRPTFTVGCRILVSLSVLLAFAETASAWRADFPGYGIYACNIYGCQGGNYSGVRDAASLPGGDVIVVGELDEGGYAGPLGSTVYSAPDALIARVDLATGAIEWSFRFVGADVSTSEIFTHVAVAPDGNIFVGGTKTVIDQQRSWIAKLRASDGSQIWSVVISDDPQSTVHALAADSGGNVIVSIGNDSASNTFSILALSTDLSNQPGLLWSYTAPNTSGVATDLALDGAGDVIAVGKLTGTPTDTGFAAVKLLGSDGSEIWRKEVLTDADAPAARATSVALTSGGDAIVGGYSHTDATGNDILVVRLAASDGSVLWQSALSDSSANADSVANDVAVDAAGTVYVGGSLGEGGTLAALSGADGSTIWSATYAVLAEFAEPVNSIAVTAAGSLVATAGIHGSEIAYGGPFETLSVDLATGNQQWAQTVENPAVPGGAGYKVLVAQDGGIIAGGFTHDPFQQGWSGTTNAATLVKLRASDGFPGDCGNGVVDAGEECDPGMPLSNGCCSSTCTKAAEGTPCDDGQACSTGDACTDNAYCAFTSSYCECGNGITTGAPDGEVCDDGNTADGDCCSSDCHQVTPCHCGDGVLDADEECDDGNLLDGDCCSKACSIEAACGDHFKCYKSANSKDGPVFSSQTVTLADAVSSSPIALSKVDRLCNPVDKEGEGINDPTLHLECYKGKLDGDSGYPGDAVVAANQFGRHPLDVGKVSSVCIPTSKNGVATDLNADAFKCYKAKGSALSNVTVTLQDQFETKFTVIGSPALFCTPAASSLAAIDHPTRKLVCYKIKDEKLDPKQAKFAGATVTTQNNLGSESVHAGKAGLLCVPSTIAP